MNKLNKKPLVSVIMPVYNAGDFLVEAIESIISQTYKNWELIAVDDGSTDDSYSILRRYAKKDKRIKVYKNAVNLGVGATGNVALAHAKGEFIARQDADDASLPDRLENQVNYLLKHSKTVVVGGSLQVVNSEGAQTGIMKYPTKFETIKQMIFVSMPVAQPGFMVNRKLLPSNFVWYDNKVTVAEEVELLFKLFQYGSASNLKKVVLRYRVHGNNTSLVSPKRTFYVTLRTRIGAIGKYGYRPTIKGVLITFAQFMIISIIPERWVYPLYASVRGFKKRVTNFIADAEIQFAR